MTINLDIATGASRRSRVYTNKKVSWSDFADTLAVPVRTGETLAEYEAADRDTRSNIKDVGGYVGGYLEDGSRKKLNHRSLIALDLDNADDPENVWQVWLKSYPGTAGVMHSTHSHTKSQPRLRFVIPLAGPVDADMYTKAAKMIGETLGAEQMDRTTYESARLMYWPSCPVDAEYVYKRSNGAPINPDILLRRLIEGSPELEVGRKGRMTLAKDKKGVAGVFCRAVPIRDAISRFIPDYLPSTDMPGRYTYRLGSSSNGVVIYDGEFSQSFHSTDPAGGQECNAFDLVRLHRFRDLDKDVPEGTDPADYPSYREMCEFALSLPEVREQLAEETAEELTPDLAQVSTHLEWTEKLQRTKSGRIRSSASNIDLILSNDPDLMGLFGFDEFSRRPVALKKLPWRDASGAERDMKNIDDVHIRTHLEKIYGITGKDKIMDVTQEVINRHRFHPVRDYLNSLSWDGQHRLDTLLIDFFATDDTPFVRAITRKALLAAVKRVFHPGCQFDSMLVLKGPQGCGKSSFFRKLSKGWFSDSVKDIRSKDAAESLQGVWITEMSELSALRRVDAETIKSFLSSPVDRFRPAYGRRTETYPRQGIFVASTNEVTFLQDRTGNRRFWIAHVLKEATPKMDVFRITDDYIDQVWAEAKHLHDLGKETIYLDRKMEEESRKVQESFLQEDPMQSRIIDYLDRKLPQDWRDMTLGERQTWLESDAAGTVERDRVCAAEIWCEALGHNDTRDMKRSEALEINRILDSLPDWERAQSSLRFPIYGKCKCFVRLFNLF